LSFGLTTTVHWASGRGCEETDVMRAAILAGAADPARAARGRRRTAAQLTSITVGVLSSRPEPPKPTIW
jgi:hypothetical protein